MRTNNVNDVELLLSKLSKQELCELYAQFLMKQTRQAAIHIAKGLVCLGNLSDMEEIQRYLR